ncbi:MAG: SCP2 sterol-binding domain-containing protein [Halobacteriota archaeon]
MAIPFPSEEWIEEWRSRLNENERYAEVGADWGVDFNGDFVFTIEADDAFDETHHYFVGLEGGECTAAQRVDDPDEVDHAFRLTGTYTSWKELSRGEIGAIAGILRGKFELIGDRMQVLQYSDAAVEMVETATELDTEYRA